MNLVDLRIAFIAGTLGQGGAERQLYYILKTLKGNGGKLLLITFGENEFWEERIRTLGVKVICAANQRSFFERILKTLNHLREFKPDIIQSQHFYTNLYAYIASIALGAKGIGAIRNDVLSEIEGLGPVWGKTSLFYPKFTAANSLKAITTARASGKPPDSLFYLPNVVDTDEFSPNPVKTFPEIPLVISIGRLYRQKRFDRLLRVAAICYRKGLKAKFGLYGEGVLRQELENYRDELELPEDYFQFMGRSEKIAEIYKSADILVSTSDFEGSPNVVLEAMSSGLPVVSTRAGGVVDLITDRLNGFLYDSDDEEGIAFGIQKLIECPDLRSVMAKNNRDLILQAHSLATQSRHLEALYQSCAHFYK